ncbi:MAG: DUF6918 family protein [Prochlorothrix sp.]|nr:hypothetical protein [Prochlorothrix sp.]
MATLQEQLLDSDRRDRVVADLTDLMAQQVQRQQGIWGILVRQGFSLFKKLENGRFIERALVSMLPEGAKALDPYYQSYCFLPKADRPDFGTYLDRSRTEVVEAILAITDRRRDQSQNPLLVMTYDGLRAQVFPAIEQGIVDLGAVIERHVQV